MRTHFTISLIIGAASAALAGCATPSREEMEHGDPAEGVNRPIYGFNEMVNERVVAPVADRVDGSMSDGAKSGANNTVHHIKNVFSNLGEPSNALNGALQGNAATVGVAVTRFAINSTVGLLGYYDAADAVHIHERREDFGQTLGKWGTASGPYMVAPLGGPTNARDFSGAVVDGVINPVRLPSVLSTAKVGVNAVDSLDQAQDVAAKPEDQDNYLLDREDYERARQAEIDNTAPPAHEHHVAPIEHRYGVQPEAR